jgi:hypothetical protein
MKCLFTLSFIVCVLAMPAQQYHNQVPKPKTIGPRVWGHSYVALKLAGFETFSYGRYPNAMYFQFKPAGSDFIIQKNILMSDISRLANLSIGVERSCESRFYMCSNFSFSPKIDTHFSWNYSTGLGYVFSLTKDERALLRPRIDMAFGSYRNKIGTNFSNDQDIILEGHDLGRSITSITYINRCLSVSPGMDMVYQFDRITLFAGISYYMPLLHRELIQFKMDRVRYPLELRHSGMIHDAEGYTVSENAVENIGFLQARAGLSVIIGESSHVAKKKVAEF